MMQNLMEQAIAYIRALFEGNSGGHDAAHSLRVYRLALRIADTEPGCDRQTVALAALLLFAAAFGIALADRDISVLVNGEAVTDTVEIDLSRVSTMQLTAELTRRLHQEGYFIQIETNGTIALKEGCEVDWITCSPKRLPIIINKVDELKVLFMHQNMTQYDGIEASEYRLQPLDTGDEERNRENVKDTINYILANPKWHLSLQTHKILNVR